MADRLQTGMVLGDFRIEERLYQGGMAELWRVTRPNDPMPLVMKVPLIRDSDDPTPIVGFEVEQMILPRLSGPHVPRFVAAGDFSAQPYIVMERVPGPSLRARLDALPLPVGEVAQIGAKVAVALQDVHRQHVLHLDIKPSNLMLRQTGEVVLVDFGLSRHEHLPDLLAEEFRLPFGTSPYISPEQVLENRSDPRSDLFALGAMLYFLLTGIRPFGIPHGRRGLRRRLWRDPVPPRALRRDCPPWLQEIVLRCLEVDPAARHATAAQLAFDLQHPDQMSLTERAHRITRAALWPTIRRWFKALRADPAPPRTIAGQLAGAPIILAAIDLTPGQEELADALRVIIRRIFSIEPSGRLACVNVLKTSRIGVDLMEDAQGRNLHLQRLVELRHWAHALALAPDRVTFTVLDAPDVADALIEYARRNQVDHVVIGARASSSIRRYLGSVSSQVVARAPCSVTVVRLPGRSPGERDEPGHAAADVLAAAALPGSDAR